MSFKITKPPNLSLRKITNFPKNIVFALILFLISAFILKVEDRKRFLKILGAQTELQQDQETIYRWEKMVEDNPNYRDAWLQLSDLYYRLSEKEQALKALLKAKELDPNNEIIPSLEKLLEE